MHNDQDNNMNVQWTRHEHSMFVNVVANGSNGLEEIAGMIPGKQPDEVEAYYKAVVGELLEIEAGRVELPGYPDGDSYPSKTKKAESVVNEDSRSKPREKERKKARNPWTIEEHKGFLDGLKKYGKGDWKSISRMVVMTRTPTQVACHAQKFFLRQALPEEGNNNDKKRKKKTYSIHDITTTDDASTTASPSDLSGEQSNGSQERVAQSSVTLSPSI
ncbi:transcription factor DIVARICATA-like [Bidens hawaiensis]|uniref:transcription factor DIVARICATA-like n=1 Tax=Bidens hawaiensis TaxID=980011 RepID=UPI00404B075F